MTAVFGADWQTDFYETLNPAALFSPSTSFIFMEGSDNNADAMSAFLNANLTAMQDWVSSGGRLFLNAAPNEGGDINFGFGVTLNYDGDNFATSSAEAVNPAAPIFNGPSTPVGTSWTGDWFAHATIAGTGLNPLIENTDNGLIVLAETSFGQGHVLFGGMTLPHFHSPQIQSDNLLDNILSYGAGGNYARQTGVSITSPTNGASFTTNQSFTFSANAYSPNGIQTLALYTNSILVASISASNISTVLSNLPSGSYALTAVAADTNGLAITSAVVYVTVNVSGTTLINFDPLDASAGAVGEPGDLRLANYLAQYGVSVTDISPGTAVVVENQTNMVAGGGFVIPSSLPNLLTQIGSNGPVSFTVVFSNLLTQFSFTRPELLANPSVSLPAWQVQALDALGQPLPLAATNEPQISSFSNVPAQIYTLSGGGIASVEFSSEGSGLTTFNAMLLDDFVLTPGNPGNAGNLPPAVAITNPTNGEVITSAEISIIAEAVRGKRDGDECNFLLRHQPGRLGPNQSVLHHNESAGQRRLRSDCGRCQQCRTEQHLRPCGHHGGHRLRHRDATHEPDHRGWAGSWYFSVTTTGNRRILSMADQRRAIPGATLSSYTVSNAPFSAAGNYTVIAVSGGQSITSAPAVLTVLGPPTVSPISEVLSNGNFILSVIVSDMATNFYTKWLLNGNGIAGATNSYLAGTVTNFYTNIDAAFNSGNYEVVVANVVAATNSLPLPVNLGPTNVITTNNSSANSLTIDPLGGPPAWPVAGSNSSSSSGPSQIAGKPAAGFLWYNWTPTNSGIIFLTTRGSSFRHPAGRLHQQWRRAIGGRG